VLANVFLGAAAHLLGSGVTVTTTGEVWQVMLRAGLWLTVALVFVAFFAGRAKLSSTVTALVLFLGTIAAFFLALQSYRLKVQRVHSFYLYWDRYLVSEYIPVLFVVLGLALTVVWTLWAREWTVRLRASTRPGFRALPAIVATLLALAAVVPTLPQLVLVEKDTFMAGAYQFDHDLAALVPNASDKVIWSASRAYASPAVVPGFVFPNTWMAFAKPMTRTFGLDVVDLDNRSDTRPDEVLTATMLEQQAACSSATSFVVFESELGGPALDSRVTTPGITFTALGSKRSDISLLSQPPKNGDWTHFRLTVRAWTVTIDPALVSAVSCPTK
jgi:hypothetical protein